MKRILLLRWVLLLGLGIISLAILLYFEENWRGKRDWENCKRESEAQGCTLDWNDYIPPPIPDAQNFYKAPHMAQWFTMSRTNSVNLLVKRLGRTTTRSLVIADVAWQQISAYTTPRTNGADLVLRYSAPGPAVFLPSTNTLIPTIEMYSVPLTLVLENLARVGKIEYILDPKIGYGQPDSSGHIKLVPKVTVHWENLSARQALLSLINKYDLQFENDPKSKTARITLKNSAAPSIYASSAVEKRVEELFQNVLGKNLVSAQSWALLMNTPSQIKPARIIVESEKPLKKRELLALFSRLSLNEAGRIGSLSIHVDRSGSHAFRIVAEAMKAGDYLAWSDQFKPEFDAIRTALKRPYARMDGNYSDVISAPIPDFVAMRAVSQMLAQRAQCDLLLGQSDKALQELELLDDFRQVLENRPSGKVTSVVTAMVNVAIAGLITEVINDGFDLHSWQEPQLAILETRLKGIDLPPFLVEALKAEPAGFCSWAERRLIPKKGSSLVDLFNIKAPAGWIYQNMVNIARLDHLYLKGFYYTNNYVSPRVCDKTAHEIDEFLKNDSVWDKLTMEYKLLAMVAVPNYVKTELSTAHQQTMINETRIVCALERYKLEHGKYPNELGALKPKFIDRVPQDIIDGKKLKYRREADGQFLLYSTGWDELDGNGMMVRGNLNSYDKGDWVWPMQ